MGALAEGFLGTGLEYDAWIARSRGVSGESAALVAQRRGRGRTRSQHTAEQTAAVGRVGARHGASKNGGEEGESECNVMWMWMRAGGSGCGCKGSAGSR
jgi:hypothetical protein